MWSRGAGTAMWRLWRFTSIVETENAVTFVRIRAESINLIQNRALGSYKPVRLTQNRFNRVQTPTGPSGQILSTQRDEFRAGRGEYIERII